MTITPTEILLYMGALAILVLIPGPVVVALVARAMSGGFHAAWPLAVGVVVGDIFWPLLAIFGVSLLVELYADFLVLLRYGGAALLIWMGARTIRSADKPLATDGRLTASGMWSGFTAGVMIIIGNPKAILFYMGVLPGFFDVSTLTALDIAAICFVSGLVPLAGNVVFALSIDRLRVFLSSPESIRRANIAAGVALVVVGAVIAVL